MKKLLLLLVLVLFFGCDRRGYCKKDGIYIVMARDSLTECMGGGNLIFEKWKNSKLEHKFSTWTTYTRIISNIEYLFEKYEEQEKTIKEVNKLAKKKNFIFIIK